MHSALQRFCAGSSMTPEQLHHLLNPRRPISREEQLHRFSDAIYPLYWQAERARTLGISWRNFCVGCAVWAFREDAHSHAERWRVFYGMNTKVYEGSRNICAEPIPLGSALASAYTEIIGMVIVGHPRVDEPGPYTKTLHPCIHCRLLMKHHPLIKPHTIIITAHPPPNDKVERIDDVPHEIHSFEEFLKKYGEL